MILILVLVSSEKEYSLKALPNVSKGSTSRELEVCLSVLSCSMIQALDRIDRTTLLRCKLVVYMYTAVAATAGQQAVLHVQPITWERVEY